MKRTAVAWLVEALQKRGVTVIATLCGHGLDPLFDAAHKAGLRLLDTRNEQTAGYVAECYGRLTGTPGVCASSSGVAVANAMTGVLNAWFDQAPMLYLSGSANRTTLGLGCFQDLDQAALVRPVARYSQMVDTPERMVQMLAQAWDSALTPPRGPAHLMLPMDVQRAEVDEAHLVPPNDVAAQAGASAGSVLVAAAALRQSRKPLIVAGSGIYYDREETAALLACAERLSIPVTTPIWDRGIMDRERAVFVGVSGALSSDPGLPARADCLILAGAVGDYRLGYLQQAQRVERLDAGWRQLDQVLGNAHTFPDWLAEARAIRQRFTERIEALAESQRVAGRMHAIDIVRAIESQVPAEATLLFDAGSVGQWAHHLLAARRYPGHWLSCGRSGVVGYGVGGAMAARLADPSRPVVLLSGDGSFTFTVADLECAVRNKLPFTAIVADDQCWGITHSGHLRQFGQGLATQLGAIDFVGLARALGATGTTVTRAADLGPALQDALQTNTVTVLHVPISGGNPGV